MVLGMGKPLREHPHVLNRPVQEGGYTVTELDNRTYHYKGREVLVLDREVEQSPRRGPVLPARKTVVVAGYLLRRHRDVNGLFVSLVQPVADEGERREISDLVGGAPEFW